MRDIKFRAWHKKLKKFIGKFDLNWLSEFTVLTLVNEKGNLDLQQYTGLKDKNGQEIYEGDIIEYDHPNAGYGRTDIPNTLKLVVPDIEMLYEDSEWNEHIYPIRNGVVIGNIHQNPELLQEA